MIKIKKINYYLLIAIFCLFFFPIQSQAAITSVTLTWSTNTYVPINYQGKALPSRGSRIEVVANINSADINPKELFYNWFLDDHIQKESSGQGRQVFKFNIGERNKKRSVKVDVGNAEKTFSISSSYLMLKPQEPEIVLETTSIPTFSGLTQEYEVASDQTEIFTAQPYFFNIGSINDLKYKWSLAGSIAEQNNSRNPNVFTLKIGKLIKSIKQKLNLWVENINYPLQRTQTTAEINFVP